MKFFFDNCISVKYVRALKILAEVQGYELIHLSEKFDPENAKDPEWIRALGEEGDWVIVPGDPRISRSPAERNAWRESGLTAFFFGDGWSSQGFWKQAEDLIRWWPRIVLEARRAPAGSGYLVQLRAKDFKQIYPT